MNQAGGVSIVGQFLVEVLPGNLGGIDEIEDMATETLSHHLQLGTRKASVGLVKDLALGPKLGLLSHDNILADEERVALGTREGNGAVGVEGPLRVNPPDRDADCMEELGFFTALGETTHDSGVAGPGDVFFFGKGERPRVVYNHVAHDAGEHRAKKGADAGLVDQQPLGQGDFADEQAHGEAGPAEQRRHRTTFSSAPATSTHAPGC